MSSTKDALCMCDLCRKRAAAYSRAEAFGAIRRAAEVARTVENYDLYWTGFGIRKNPDSVKRANEIRRAIRAAIGSDEA